QDPGLGRARRHGRLADHRSEPGVIGSGGEGVARGDGAVEFAPSGRTFCSHAADPQLLPIPLPRGPVTKDCKTLGVRRLERTRADVDGLPTPGSAASAVPSRPPREHRMVGDECYQVRSGRGCTLVSRVPYETARAVLLLDSSKIQKKR